MKMNYRLLIALGIVVFLLAAMLWARPFSYKPSREALDSIAAAYGVRTIDVGWFGTAYAFSPEPAKAQGKGFILYPGGLIDPRAYALLMRALAAKGYLAIIVAMPFDLAVFGGKRADAVMEQFPGITTWALGGHSLGGVMACRYARTKADKIAGLVLLASYPSSRFRIDAMHLRVLSVFGTRDGLTTMGDIEASKRHLPEGSQFVKIQGGNHSQFCSLSKKGFLYRGDEPATIPPERQQQEVVGAVGSFLKTL